MAQDDSSALLILLVAAIAVVGMVLSASTFYAHNTFGGMMGGGNGMMGGGTTTTETAGPGALEWAVLLVSVALFVGTLFLFIRFRSATRQSAASPATQGVTAIPSPSVQSAAAATPAQASEVPVDGLTLMKLLDEDEKRMYLELRDHGGTMFQKDIVSLGVFSKAKVTRVLDKLEAKGIVVREAHGMTNRVRIVPQAQR